SFINRTCQCDCANWFSIALRGFLAYQLMMKLIFSSKRLTLLWVCCWFFTFRQTVSAENPSVQKSLLGFSSEGAVQERALEMRFDSLLNRDHLRQWMKRLTARPHHLGSAYDKENAEFIAGQFRSWGYETAIEEFQVLFPTPKLRLLEMIAPKKFTADLKEPPLAEDSTSSQTQDALPVYN